MANGTRVGGRSIGRWLALLLIPTAFAVSVWSATGGSKILSIGKLQPIVMGEKVKTEARGGLGDTARQIQLPISISMTKTVGTSPTGCASTQLIHTPPGNTTVYYCYSVKNTGLVTFYVHDLVDSRLGTILSGEDLVLPPFASTFITTSTSIDVTTVNTATWTAYTQIGGTAPGTPRGGGFGPSASDSDTATVIVDTPTPTLTPTNTATNTPTNTPTLTPSSTPTATSTSTATPSNTPTNTPTPTLTSTSEPTINPPAAPEIPTLSGVGTALLALILGAIAALHLRRRG